MEIFAFEHRDKSLHLRQRKRFLRKGEVVFFRTYFDEIQTHGPRRRFDAHAGVDVLSGYQRRHRHVRGRFLVVAVDGGGIDAQLRELVVEQHSGAGAFLTVDIAASGQIGHTFDAQRIAFLDHDALDARHALDQRHLPPRKQFSDVRDVVFAGLHVQKMRRRDRRLASLQG